MHDKHGILHVHVYLLICLVQSPDKICQCMVTTVLNQSFSFDPCVSLRIEVYICLNKHVSKSKYQFDAFNDS